MYKNIEQSEPIYSISTAARLLKISVHTLRMYEREGLFIPHKNTCKERECRSCEVYSKYSQCGTIKELIKSISR